EETAGRRHQAARLLARDHGSELQGDQGAQRRSRLDQRQLQEDLRLGDVLHLDRLSVVPGRRSWLRQFHGASRPELIQALATKEKPRGESSGVFVVLRFVRYCLAGGPKSSGGGSICGTSILTLLRSTATGLSSSPVTVTGKAITSSTMMA